MTAPGTYPVVLLHALALNSSMWDAQRSALEALGHRVLAPDQRGFGGVPLGDAPPSLDLVADDLARTLDEAGIGRFTLVGSSMGGYTAMAFLRRHPGRVRALALLATKASADDPAARAERERFAAAITDDDARPALIAATTPRLVGATTRAARPEVVARLRETVAAESPESIAWAQRAIAARPDSYGTLRDLDVPALVIAGQEDELIPLAEPFAMAQALRQGRRTVIAGAGHLPPAEVPERVTEALVGLLTGVG